MPIWPASSRASRPVSAFRASRRNRDVWSVTQRKPGTGCMASPISGKLNDWSSDSVSETPPTAVRLNLAPRNAGCPPATAATAPRTTVRRSCRGHPDRSRESMESSATPFSQAAYRKLPTDVQGPQPERAVSSQSAPDTRVSDSSRCTASSHPSRPCGRRSGRLCRRVPSSARRRRLSLGAVPDAPGAQAAHVCQRHAPRQLERWRLRGHSSSR